MRGGGRPTYQLANPLDDLAMGITHVIRGEDLLSSTPRQKLLVEALEGGATVTTGEQVAATDVLAGLPVLGESDLYDALADRLITLASDPDLRRRLGAAGRDRARRELDIADTARAYERLITEVARGR